MPLLILLTMLIGTSFGAEVATLDNPKSNSTEILLVMTDETLQSLVDKNFMVHTCRPRTNTNGSLKEFYFMGSCRAEITKFLLNNGYKADNLSRTFSK